jgi:NADPH:quinone reductase-like Zn-dependent oxidoreductase
MKAFVVERYGPSGLRAAEVPDPTVGPDRAVVTIIDAANLKDIGPTLSRILKAWARQVLP